MNYRIKMQAIKIAELIDPKAGSALILKTALENISMLTEYLEYPGYISLENIEYAVKSSIPDLTTAEQWYNTKIIVDNYYHQIRWENIFCGAEFRIDFFIGNTQDLVLCSFITCEGGGREYRIVDDNCVINRIRFTREII